VKRASFDRLRMNGTGKNIARKSKASPVHPEPVEGLLPLLILASQGK
jgi:hypothetical protein